jgi:hypothetical protein
VGSRPQGPGLWRKPLASGVQRPALPCDSSGGVPASESELPPAVPKPRHPLLSGSASASSPMT